MEHHAYSPDSGPSNYHLLPALKECLEGHRFKSHDNMETVAKTMAEQKGHKFPSGENRKTHPTI